MKVLISLCVILSLIISFGGTTEMVSNEVFDGTTQDTETRCAGGWCSYSNATCCKASHTCCREGTICLDPLRICLGIRFSEEDNVTPVLYTEKTAILKRNENKNILDASSGDTDAVTDCPPFLIPCFGYCCPPGITYCNSQRRACEPYYSNRYHNLFLLGSSGKGPSYSVEEPMMQKIPTVNSEKTAALIDVYKPKVPPCDPSICVLPECCCDCDGTRIPDLEQSETHQTILLTFDGDHQRTDPRSLQEVFEQNHD